MQGVGVCEASGGVSHQVHGGCVLRVARPHGVTAVQGGSHVNYQNLRMHPVISNSVYTLAVTALVLSLIWVG